jgi:hypothetical protein
VRYEKFDGKYANGDYVPQEILDAFNVKDDPSLGALWGPTHKGVLSLSFFGLKLYWWEIKDAPYVARTLYRWIPPEVAYDPDGAGPLPGTTGHDGYFVARSGTYWGTPLDCFPTGEIYNNPADPHGPQIDAAHLNKGMTTVPTTSPKPRQPSRFFVAPHGWWKSTGWNWRYFYDNYAWNGTYYAPQNGYGWFGPWGFGGYGYGYGGYGYGYGGWNGYGYGGGGYWGGYWYWPPTEKQLQDTLAPESEAPPQPVGYCGWTIRRYLYGYVAWSAGWNVLAGSVDKDEQTCDIYGNIRPEVRSIPVNTEVPERTPDGEEP